MNKKWAIEFFFQNINQWVISHELGNNKKTYFCHFPLAGSQKKTKYENSIFKMSNIDFCNVVDPSLESLGQELYKIQDKKIQAGDFLVKNSQ